MHTKYTIHYVITSVKLVYVYLLSVADILPHYEGWGAGVEYHFQEI